jgi:diguanylate cyclase (GGDEF)-like protein/PAS domain S-box-containing protein
MQPTEQKPPENEEELSQTFLNRMYGVLENLDFIVYIVDSASQQIVYTNERFKQIFGEMQGQYCWKVFNDTPASLCESCDKSNKNCVSTERFHTASGRWFDVNCQRVEWAKGEMRCAFLVSDITQRKQMETELYKSRMRLANSLETAGQVVWEWNLETDAILFENLAPVLGWAQEMISERGGGMLRHIHRPDRKRVLEKVKQVLSEENDIFEVEFRVISSGHDVHWLYVRGRIVERTATGRARRMVGAVQDISARKFAEEKTEALFMANMALASTLNFDEVTQIILNQIGRVIPIDSTSIYLLRGDELELVGARGFSETAGLIGRRVKLEKGRPSYEVITTLKPLRVEDVQAEYPGKFISHSRFIRGWLGVPLISQGKILGMLALDSHQPGHFLEEDEKAALAFANQVVVAIENSRLYSEAQRRITELSILNEIAQSLSTPLEMKDFLELVYQQVNRFIKARNFFVASFDQDEDIWECIFLRDEHEEDIENWPRYKSDHGATGYVIQSRKPLRVCNDADYEVFRKAANRQILGAPSKSWMGVPLIVGGKVVGVMVAQSYEFENYFSEEDLSLFAIIAPQVAAAFENARLFSRMQYLAITDPLTGLFNRWHFFKLAEREVMRALRYQKPLSVIIFDIDHFKDVNDRNGHLVGDRALQSIAQVCLLTLRKIDICARYGGEEFIVLLPETGLDDASAAAERLRKAIEEASLFNDVTRINVTASLGVSDLDLDVPDLEKMIGQADQALYVAKQAGRNRVCIYKESSLA